VTLEGLSRSLVTQARQRLLLVQTAVEAGYHAVAVRESQEVMELALKGMLRAVGVEPAKVHDVGLDLKGAREMLENTGVESVEELCRISKRWRKERELSFYGEVDFLPGESYNTGEAREAFSEAQFCVEAAETVLRKMKG
jgi:HEPN domain-containing protein